MTPMNLTLTFYIHEPHSCEDLDEFSDLVREAIDTKIGECDYMVQDISGYDVQLEIYDE